MATAIIATVRISNANETMRAALVVRADESGDARHRRRADHHVRAATAAVIRTLLTPCRDIARRGAYRRMINGEQSVTSRALSTGGGDAGYR
jgi:hypothetical protein